MKRLFFSCCFLRHWSVFVIKVLQLKLQLMYFMFNDCLESWDSSTLIRLLNSGCKMYFLTFFFPWDYFITGPWITHLHLFLFLRAQSAALLGAPPLLIQIINSTWSSGFCTLVQNSIWCLNCTRTWKCLLDGSWTWSTSPKARSLLQRLWSISGKAAAAPARQVTLTGVIWSQLDYTCKILFNIFAGILWSKSVNN